MGGPSRPPISTLAQDFEEILLTHLVKGMRLTVPESEEPSHMTRMYRDLFDERLAADIARRGGIGLAAVTDVTPGSPDSRVFSCCMNAARCPPSARNWPSPVPIRLCPSPKTPRKRGSFWDGRG